MNRPVSLAAVICAAVLGWTAFAQEAPAAGTGGGTIQGTVHVMPWDEALPEATVTVEGTALKAVSDLEGRFEIKDVPAGTYRVRVSFSEYKPQVLEVVVAAGQTAAVQAGLVLDEIRGEEIVVVGSKFPEKRLEAPVTVETVGQTELKMVGSSSYLAALSTMKGIDYTDNGVGEKRISARGFNTQFNSRMLFMVDGRLATLPGNGLPQGSLLPTSSLDIHSVEVVVGPASALYGANAHTGVVNIVTKTPWDDPGVSVALRGGSQNLLDGSARVAGTFNKNLGYKLNAQLMRGTDWQPDRTSRTHYYGTTATPVFEGDLVSSYDLFSAKAEGFLYYRLGDWNLKGGYGFSVNDGFTLTNAGRNHLRGWQVHYQTVQVSHSNWFAQLTRTVSNAGATYQMERLAGMAAASGGAPLASTTLDTWRDQIKFIDNSELLDSELQYRNEWGALKLTTGVQARLYRPSSSGSYLADANGVQLQAEELGGYVQGDYALLPEKLRLVGAARLDTHSNYAPQLSPKAAVVYTVAKGHHLRAGYNRAFKSPTILENYLMIAGTLLGNRTGFTVKDASGAVIGEIQPLEPERVDSVEVGYKGSIADRIFVDAVAYHSWYDKFISPLTLRASPATRGTYAFFPDGTPTAEGTAAQGGLSTYSNFGNARVAGADVGVDYAAMPGVSLNGSVSFIRMLHFQNTDPTMRDLLLNVPEWKFRGSVTVQDIGVKSSFLRVSGRYQGAYAFESGRWVSANFFEGGKIPARFVADLAVGYKLQNGLTLSGNVFNLLDDRGIDVLGAPPSGRFAYVQVQYDFTGLDF